MSELRPSVDSKAEYMYSRGGGAAYFDIINFELRELLLVSEEMYSPTLVPPPLPRREIPAQTLFPLFIAHNFWADDPYPFKIGEAVA